MIFVRKRLIIALVAVSILTVFGFLYITDYKEIISKDTDDKAVKNNHTQYRLFIDELFLLQDQAHITFKESLNAHIPWAKFEKNLESKKRAYNISFVTLLKKYDICPNDLYGELDNLWDNAKEEFRKAFVKFAPTTVPAGTASDFAMRQGWDIYMQGTKKFAQQCSKILLKQSKNGK